jgi:UDP-GlcNAc:undecaprenyl-phosphate GlcNAc-1-phosphate transferase
MNFFYFLSILTIVLLLNSSKIGLCTNLLDLPSKYKLQKKIIPSVGGLIIFINLIICYIYFVFFYNEIIKFNFLLFISLFFLIGLIDDIYNINSKYRILLSITVSLFFFFLDDTFIIEKIYSSFFNSEFYFGNFKIPITIICIVFFFIAMNMMDGINCLLISFSFFSIVIYNFIIFGLPNLDILSLVFLVTLFLMFYFNFNSQIFLGNSGASLIAGYFIYLLITNNYHSRYDVLEITSIPLIMGIDMVRIFFFRILNNKNILDRDNNHFHHILLKKFGLLNALIIYINLSFGPIFLAKFTNINIIFFFFISPLLYFIIINYCKETK